MSDSEFISQKFMQNSNETSQLLESAPPESRRNSPPDPNRLNKIAGGCVLLLVLGFGVSGLVENSENIKEAHASFHDTVTGKKFAERILKQQEAEFGNWRQDLEQQNRQLSERINADSQSIMEAINNSNRGFGGR